MTKTYRQGQILKLIHRRRIDTQEELAAELARLGVPATQVTLSRDIRELGLVKTGAGYQRVQPESGGPDLATVIAEFLLDIRAAQNLVILKTMPGNAGAMAVALDRVKWPEVIGTIAGDDTVLVIAPDLKTAARVRDKLLLFAP